MILRLGIAFVAMGLMALIISDRASRKRMPRAFLITSHDDSDAEVIYIGNNT